MPDAEEKPVPMVKRMFAEKREKERLQRELERQHRIRLRYYHKKTAGNNWLQWLCWIACIPALPVLAVAAPFYGWIILMQKCVMKIDDKRHEKEMALMEQIEKDVDSE